MSGPTTNTTARRAARLKRETDALTLIPRRTPLRTPIYPPAMGLRPIEERDLIDGGIIVQLLQGCGYTTSPIDGPVNYEVAGAMHSLTRKRWRLPYKGYHHAMYFIRWDSRNTTMGRQRFLKTTDFIVGPMGDMVSREMVWRYACVADALCGILVLMAEALWIINHERRKRYED